MSDFDVLDEVERLKAESRFLRGTLEIGLEDPVSGAIAESDTKLLKFHGIYQQDDRDQRKSRQQALLEPLCSSMLRVRIPDGVLRPAQWLAMETLARRAFWESSVNSAHTIYSVMKRRKPIPEIHHIA